MPFFSNQIHSPDIQIAVLSGIVVMCSAYMAMNTHDNEHSRRVGVLQISFAPELLAEITAYGKFADLNLWI